MLPTSTIRRFAWLACFLSMGWLFLVIIGDNLPEPRGYFSAGVDLLLVLSTPLGLLMLVVLARHVAKTARLTPEERAHYHMMTLKWGGYGALRVILDLTENGAGDNGHRFRGARSGKSGRSRSGNSGRFPEGGS